MAVSPMGSRRVGQGLTFARLICNNTALFSGGLRFQLIKFFYSLIMSAIRMDRASKMKTACWLQAGRAFGVCLER